MLSLPVVIVVFLPPFYARYGNTLAQKQTTALKTHLKRRPRLHSEKKGGGVGMGKTAGWLEKNHFKQKQQGKCGKRLGASPFTFSPGRLSSEFACIRSVDWQLSSPRPSSFDLL